MIAPGVMGDPGGVAATGVADPSAVAVSGESRVNGRQSG